MPGKMAIVDFNKCKPDQCSDNGLCPAVKACFRKLLKQDSLHEPPMMNPAICRGCTDCTRACPLKAIKVVNV